MRISSIAKYLCLLVCSICFSGCLTVVRPAPTRIRSMETGEERVVSYPAKVVSHSTLSAWDIHQVKDNIICLGEFEFVRVADMGIDLLIPGRSVQPIGSGVEQIKYGYSMLPNCAPVRIIDGLFTALALEKLSVSRISTYFIPRVFYLTDWVQDTLGEVNTGLGKITPWPGPFVPTALTDPLSDGTDWCQKEGLGLYLSVLFKVNTFVDKGLYGVEKAWGWSLYPFLSKQGGTIEREPNPLPQEGAAVVK